jgi:hypothetical protein
MADHGAWLFWWRSRHRPLKPRLGCLEIGAEAERGSRGGNQAGFVLQKDRLEQKLTTKRSKSGDVRWIAIDVSILIKPNQFQALTPKPISL